MSRRVIIFCYRLLLAIGFPFLLLYLLLRIGRDRRYAHRLSERFGSLPFEATQRGGIWLHAVSVGEVLSAVALLQQLRETLPATPLYVSVTTLAGREMAEQRLRGLADGVFFTPVDYAFAVRRVLRKLDPACVVILETEIWPNLWNEVRRRDAGLLVLNGRISDQAWPKYRRGRRFLRPCSRCPMRYGRRATRMPGVTGAWGRRARKRRAISSTTLRCRRRGRSCASGSRPRSRRRYLWRPAPCRP